MSQFWIHNDNDLMDAIEQVLICVQTEDVNSIYLSNGVYSDILDARELDKEQLVETLAGWSLAYNIRYMEVHLPQTKSIHFALAESKDGSTNITWEIIEQIVDVIAIWREKGARRWVLYLRNRGEAVQ